VIIPQPYPQEQCSKLKDKWNNEKAKGAAYCVQAPSLPTVFGKNCKPNPGTNTSTCELSGETLSTIDKRYPISQNDFNNDPKLSDGAKAAIQRIKERNGK
jgi:hypothetical protein